MDASITKEGNLSIGVDEVISYLVIRKDNVV